MKVFSAVFAERAVNFCEYHSTIISVYEDLNGTHLIDSLSVADCSSVVNCVSTLVMTIRYSYLCVEWEAVQQELLCTQYIVHIPFYFINKDVSVTSQCGISRFETRGCDAAHKRCKKAMCTLT
jgi:hypothetical protein